MKHKTKRILWGIAHSFFIGVTTVLINATCFCEKMLCRTYNRWEDATFYEILENLNKEFDR